MAGIYALEPEPINDKPHWLQNSGSNTIWCEKDGNWNIGPLGETGYILSFVKLSSPLEVTTWSYWNGKTYIDSDDILVDTFVEAGKCIGCALDKQSIKNKSVNRETVIYM